MLAWLLYKDHMTSNNAVPVYGRSNLVSSFEYDPLGHFFVVCEEDLDFVASLQKDMKLCAARTKEWLVDEFFRNFKKAYTANYGNVPNDPETSQA